MEFEPTIEDVENLIANNDGKTGSKKRAPGSLIESIVRARAHIKAVTEDLKEDIGCSDQYIRGMLVNLSKDYE